MQKNNVSGEKVYNLFKYSVDNGCVLNYFKNIQQNKTE